MLDGSELFVGKNRVRYHQTMAVSRGRIQQVLFRTDIAFERHNHVFSNRIDRRVRDLGEQLLEVVIHQPRLVAETSQCGIVPHRTDRVHLGRDHRKEHELHGFQRVAERLHAGQKRFRIKPVRLILGRQLVECDSLCFQPLLVGTKLCKGLLDFFIWNQASLFKVDQEHPTGLQSPLGLHDSGVHGKNTHLARHDHAIVGRQIIAAGA